MKEPKEIIGDIWKLFAKNMQHTIVIPTNGTETKAGKAVMGRGLAADAVRKYPSIEYRLGEQLEREGNHVFYFKTLRMITFPVKFEWFEMADLKLIRTSCQELQRCILTNKLTHVLVPRVGCGNGGQLWANVKPILLEVLDHRCLLVTYKKEL